jgi:8-oxo-dGTP pyrophosphatase MutT (NUDIX family)
VVRPELSGVKCVLTHGEHVLLVRHTYGPREWDLPGGGIKHREAPAAAARREMHEELGVEIDDLRSVGDVVGSLHHSRATLHCFRAELHEPAVTMDRGELAAVAWFSQRALPPKLGRLVYPVLRRADLAPRLRVGEPTP